MEHSGWKARLLAEVLKLTKESYLPQMSTRQYHFLQFGDTPAAVRNQRQSMRLRTDRAMQQEEEERERCYDALNDLVIHPNQLVFVDESAKDRNSSRRRRSWARRGHTLFRDEYFATYNSKHYTLIAACNVNGFIIDASETVEHEANANDNDPSRGTVERRRKIRDLGRAALRPGPWKFWSLRTPFHCNVGQCRRSITLKVSRSWLNRLEPCSSSTLPRIRQISTLLRRCFLPSRCPSEGTKACTGWKPIVAAPWRSLLSLPVSTFGSHMSLGESTSHQVPRRS